MSSKEDPPSTKPSLKKFFESSPQSAGEAREIARLSEEVEQLKDKLGEVIFLSTFIIFFLVDLFIFPDLQTWSSPIIIGLFEFAFLFILARICRVNDILVLTELIFDGIERYKGNKDKSDKDS
ncbi:hypothetical protein [Roseibium litorale]|uniref:Uncharacterized protein n=1 Tax=Roseibium litorale TaxID=2803841 RepID=A0ABR9CRY8_9HYPH|nr:hypothetical protein [Roseibium litorale]MBD8893523.1 hypothetical protein [Roseibium litorale]